MNNQQHRALHNQRICFYGAGSISEAIVKGLLLEQLIAPEQITLINRSNLQRLHMLQEQYQISIARNADEKEHALRHASIIIVAVKPSDAISALHTLSAYVAPEQLLLTVVAGLSISQIQHILQIPLPIVRAMPNTSSAIQLGATGICFSTHVTPQHQQLALCILNAIGLTTLVDESQMNWVTGISGSGPAYVYYLMESMISAGMQGGLSKEQAAELTIQTVLGAINMVQLTNIELADLRQQVTSPGGTTQAAIELLEANHFSELIIQAANRAAERANELGALISKQLGVNL